MRPSRRGSHQRAALAREVLEAPAPKPPRRSSAYRIERRRGACQRGPKPGKDRVGLARRR